MNNKPFEIIPGIYGVGGSELSHPQDALVYLIKGSSSVRISTVHFPRPSDPI